MTDKQMIKCPVCDIRFIPRTFYPDEAIFTTYDGKKLSGFNGYISCSAVKPPEVILSSWVTYCPNCNYILRFVKEIVRKEKVISPNTSDIQEKYNSYYFGFPYGDYTQHLKELVEKVKEQISSKLRDLKFDVWENLHQVNDNFKFLVRFFTNLEQYCNTIENLANQGNMITKIKKIGLPKNAEIALLQLYNIKEEMMKGEYELSVEDHENINTILMKFIFYLFQTHIKPLISKKLLQEEYNFIKFEDLETELKTYLGNYLYSNFNSNLIASKQIRSFLNNFFEELEI